LGEQQHNFYNQLPVCEENLMTSMMIVLVSLEWLLDWNALWSWSSWEKRV